MSFVSYAQNFEDVMLWRALNHIQRGTYVDIGAQAPETNSVTKAFYDAGWSGINCVPDKSFLTDFFPQRERDTNLLLVQTSPDEHEKSKSSNFVKMLSDANLEHETSEIHFFRIKGHVHGIEKELNSLIEKIRPWIFIISEPETTGLENFLLTSRYESVYYDGINKFYLATEHAELKKHFIVPPNNTDHIVRSHEFFLSQQVQEMEETIRVLQGQLEQSYRDRQKNKEELIFLYSRPSWQKKTWNFFSKLLFLSARPLVFLLSKSKRFIMKHPHIKNAVQDISYRHPNFLFLLRKFKNRLREFLKHHPKFRKFLHKTRLQTQEKMALYKQDTTSLSKYWMRFIASLGAQLTSYLYRHPEQKARVKAYMYQYPFLYNLKQFFLVSQYKNRFASNKKNSSEWSGKNHFKFYDYNDFSFQKSEELANLSPHAQRIYKDLLTAIEKHKNKMK